MPHGFDDIAFATPKKFRSLFTWSRRSGMTAEGTLAVSAGQMLFVGSEGKIEIRAPTKVAIVPVPIPWLGLGIGNAIFLLYVFINRTPHSLLTPDSPVTW